MDFFLLFSEIFNKKILISGQVNQNKEITQNFKVTPLGPQMLEGKEHVVEVFAVEER